MWWAQRFDQKGFLVEGGALRYWTVSLPGPDVQFSGLCLCNMNSKFFTE